VTRTVGVTGTATVICLTLALVLVAATGIQALRNRAITKAHLIAAAVLEVAILFYVGVRIAGLAGGHHTQGTVIVAAYLVGLVFTMPITGALAWVEPSRWSSVTLGAGALVACVLFARVNQLWTPHG